MNGDRWCYKVKTRDIYRRPRKYHNLLKLNQCLSFSPQGYSQRNCDDLPTLLASSERNRGYFEGEIELWAVSNPQQPSSLMGDFRASERYVRLQKGLLEVFRHFSEFFKGRVVKVLGQALHSGGGVRPWIEA